MMNTSTQQTFDLMADSIAALGTGLQFLKKSLADETKQPSAPTPAANTTIDIADVLDMKACSTLTGMSMSTLYKYCCNRLVPHFKMGKRNCFHKQQILQWMISNPVKTADQINAEVDSLVAKHK